MGTMQVLSYLRDPAVGKNPDGTLYDAFAKDKDFAVGLEPKLTAYTTGDVDLRTYCTDTNQFGLGSCAGNATADSVELLNAVEEEAKALAEGQPRPAPVQLSRLFVYSMARGLMDEDQDGQADINKDEGTFIRLCFEVLSRWGICDEEVWPYDTSKVFTVPSFKAIRQATGHRIHSYYRIKSTGDERLMAVRSALRAKHPVVFGTLVTDAFQSWRGPLQPIGKPKGATQGGHAMLVVGLIGNHFLVKNSWGPTWGDRGYWLMSDEYMAWDNTWDLWVPTKGSMFR